MIENRGVDFFMSQIKNGILNAERSVTLKQKKSYYVK